MTRRQNIITSLFVAVFAALVVFAMLFRTQTSDWISSLNYEPTIEMAALRDAISLTPKSQLIFGASHPQLNDRDVFVEKCPVQKENANILGCYSSSRTIHVYDISIDELDGIQESTLAHELLHAIYGRHTAATLSWLNPLLRQAYEANKSTLEDGMSFYDEDEFLNELHSRLGTEVRSLPDELEEYYANYFVDQDAVTDFFHSYNSHLVALREESVAQLSEINALANTIDSQRLTYIEDSATLTAKIEDFNRRAESGQMTTSDYNSGRAALTAEIQRLDQLYDSISVDISKHNQLVEAYNSNALHLQTLNDAMSTSPPPDL